MMDFPRDKAAFDIDKKRSLDLVSGVRDFLIEIDGSIDENLRTQLDAVIKSINAIEFNPSSLTLKSMPDVPDKTPSSPLIVDRRIEAILEEAFPPGHVLANACKRYFMWQCNRIAGEARKLHDHVKNDYSS